MKKLLLMRHAAANVQLANEDINRTLSDIGRLEILEARKFIADLKIDKVIISPSVRTQQTKDLLFQDFEAIKAEIKQELYTTNVEGMLSVIQENDDMESLLVIGHNPVIYQLALKMADKKQDSYEMLIDMNMPTCSIVELDFINANYWQEIGIDSAKIVKVFRPSARD